MSSQVWGCFLVHLLMNTLQDKSIKVGVTEVKQLDLQMMRKQVNISKG